MSITTRIQQRSIDRETWLQPIGEPILVEHASLVAAMQHLYDEINSDKAGDWTYHIYGGDGAKYTLHTAYTAVFGVAPRSTPRGYRYPLIGR